MINALTVDPESMVMKMVMTIPQLDVVTDFDIDGIIMGVAINTSGTFKGNISGCMVEVEAKTVETMVNGTDVLQFDQVSAIVSVGDVMVKIKSDDSKANALTEAGVGYFNRHRTRAFFMIQPFVNDITSDVIMSEGNKLLSMIPLHELHMKK